MASPKTRDDIEKILGTGLDLKKRRIYFGDLGEKDDGGSFTWTTVEQAVRLLHALADNSHKPIELHMCSEGGTVTEMLRLYDAIQKCHCQIKFYGSGVIASSAAFIMAGCDERYLDKHSQIMLHEGSGGVDSDDNHTDINISMSQNNKIKEDMCQILADNSRMSLEYWKDMLNRDMWLTPEEAITLGLADKITEYKKRGNLRRSRIAMMNKKIDEDELSSTLMDINKRMGVRESMKIEIVLPKEKHDKEVFVDDSPVTDEEVAELSSQHNEELQSQDPETDHS